MRFLLNLTLANGVARDEFVRHLKEDGVHPDTWELVRHRVVSDYSFKVGEKPGLVAFIEAESDQEAMDIARGLPVVQAGLVDYQLDPLSKVASF